jgi:uncharacterized protein (TIGR03083 family)
VITSLVPRKLIRVLADQPRATPPHADPVRDPERPARLLRAEHDALLPILQRTPEEAFGRPTACPGWSVRDVLAHCGAALTRVTTGRLHAFTAELNELDVAARRDWPLPRLLSELADGYLQAGSVIGDAGGALDVIALGEWLHGGDVRAALDEPMAYQSEGLDDALVLLSDWARHQAVPLLEARLPDRTIWLGVSSPGRPQAILRTGPATLMRLIAGRPADTAAYELAGASPEELVVF